MAKDFEVGKFYEVQVTPFSSKKIPALCTRVLKRKVEFQYLMRNRDGTLSKAKVSRCLQVASKDNPASAYSPEEIMKFQTLSDDEVRGIREARKLIDNIARKYCRLREKSTPDKETAHYRMYKELASLKVDIDIDTDGNSEIVGLSLPSKEYVLDED